MTNKAIPKVFLRNVMQNGLGRYIIQLQRITFNFCKSSPGSLGMRDFIEQYLLDFTRANPGIVVYLKPRRHKGASLRAEYCEEYIKACLQRTRHYKIVLNTRVNGRSEVLYTNCMPVESVCQWLEHLRTRSGEQLVKVVKPWHSDTPSIQGVWHPFLNKHPSLYTMTFPQPSLYRNERPTGSATDVMLEPVEMKDVGNMDNKMSYQQ